ncbi:MAG: TadE/TadG family type IV pilus assembly protein [Nocardioides sp.]
MGQRTLEAGVIRGLSTRQRAREERGAAALEFALVVPFLMLLLLGTVTVGLVYSDHLGVTNAAREGARYGAAADAASASWATSVQTRVQQTYFNASGAQPTDAQICVKLVKSDATVVASDAGASCGTQPALPTGMEVGSCAVLVWMSKPETIQLIAFPDLNTEIGAQSVAYYGRTVGTTCTAK